LDITVILRSESDVFRTRKLLSKVGITSRIIKKTEKKVGCVFGLSVKNTDFYSVIRVLRDNGIDYSL